ncbi:MAG: RadC family protein [Pseudanabaenaceae cyanobacterium]
MSYSLRIADMVESDRPRERLLTEGAAVLSTAELLALLLGTGQGPGKLSALGLGQLILKTFGQDREDPAAGLQNLAPAQLTAISGVGPAKAATILAAIELGKRVFYARHPEAADITDPASAAAELSRDLMWEEREKLAVLMLDNRNRILGRRVLAIGTVNEALASPREIFREALKHNAVKLIVAHNHPSGNTEPSEADRQLTRQLLQAAQFLDLPLLDHLILGQGRFTSLRETTTLWHGFG